MKKFSNVVLTYIVVMCSILICGKATPASARYFGESDSVLLKTTGCNAVSYTPLPREDNLFIGRAFFKSDGAPVTSEDGCASPEVKEAVSANRGGLARKFNRPLLAVARRRERNRKAP